MAEKYLPELKNQKVDEHLNEEAVPLLYAQFGGMLGSLIMEEKQCLIEIDDRVLACSLKILHPPKSKKIDGYLIEVVDDTKQQKYLRLLNHYNDDLEKEVKRQTAYVNKLQERMVLGMADMIENRDTNTGAL